MTSIAIIGPGALGGTVACWLAQDREHRITICARTPFERLEVETPKGTLRATPEVATDPASVQAPVDWVVVATKAYDASSAALWLKPLLGPATRVIVLQNGVERVAHFAGHVPEDRIVPAVADIPAARSAPGHMVQHRLGWIVVPHGANGDAAVQLFAGTEIDVSAVPDWQSRAWAKLCLNCAGAFTTLTMRATGPVWSREVETLVRGLVAECVDVGRAEGAMLEDSLIDQVVEGARNAPEGAGNSMYADRLAGRPMELDARNGVIVRLGQKHNIETPINALFVTLLSASGSPWIDRQQD
ncbi:putative 2-dehydropantoate 2-reductase [Devosia pacifica]|uniref:2-dehydropantoate 2-reductase n=1 Tax=Devosia pacifica TaxID=1335967 RepID=A0A918SDD7_9HYPH|nr:2-dehydropantoate 2-reductase [Devosia pacifica]GHA35768.1 putative 2-dehydropantoate 2-reductase [Devosia pacifica]